LSASASLFTDLHREQFQAADLHGKLTFFGRHRSAEAEEAEVAGEAESGYDAEGEAGGGQAAGEE
jgi:hypothetical protein